MFLLLYMHKILKLVYRWLTNKINQIPHSVSTRLKHCCGGFFSGSVLCMIFIIKLIYKGFKYSNENSYHTLPLMPFSPTTPSTPGRPSDPFRPADPVLPSSPDLPVGPKEFKHEIFQLMISNCCKHHSSSV